MRRFAKFQAFCLKRHWASGGLRLPLLLGALLAAFSPANSAHAAIIDVMRYNLGEPGSYAGQLPQDSVGTRHQTNNIGTLSFGAVTDTAAPGSTNATQYSTLTGSYGANSTGLPSDNFAVELWARSHNVNQGTNDFFTLNGDSIGSISFRAGNGVWAGHIANVAWVGAADGVGQTAIEDEWTNLAIVRSNGVSTFYIDGIAQAGTTFGTPLYGDPAGIHIGVTPGGGAYFNGDLDSIRIFTFDPNLDDPVAALSINAAVPEPSCIAIWSLGGLTGLAVVWWRRRRRAAK